MFKNFITPDNFKNDIYGWATNQISHTALPLLMVWIVGVQNVLYVVGFWIVLEIYQVIKNKLKSYRDTIEDLSFELTGAFILIYNEAVYVAIGLFLTIGAFRLWSISR